MSFEARRAEHEEKFKEIYSKWNLDVDGVPLHTLISKAQAGDEASTTKLDSFTGQSRENLKTYYEVSYKIGDGSFFPGNHRDFDQLPEGLACTMCPAFYGVVNSDPDNFEVRCEWPDRVQSVVMKLDKSKPGGALGKRGHCKTTFGISDF